MENGGLADRLLDLSINEGKDNSLFQVMKAVEAAEATIKQQVEENNRLRSELQKKEYEVEALRLDKSMAKRYHSVEHYDDHGPGSNSGHQSTMMFDTTESHSGFHRSNGTLNTPPSNQTADNAGLSQFSALSAAPFSPGRYPMDGEHDLHLRAGQGLLPVAESNDSNHHWKQQLVQKIREHEEEITQLRKHLTEYSVKETQICNEKHVLEKRIAHMRMAFDQQQQDLVDAASKALSYRQDIIEENVRLTYALQDAQQERATFVSSLLPLLAEYSLQPPVPDAQSIVSNVKVLFKHLQEKLIITEAKLKEFQYQVIPWRSDGSNPHFAPQSPQHSSGAALTSGKNGLELVQQPTYSPVNMAIAEARMATEWDLQGHHAQQAVMDGAVVRNTEIDDMGRYSPLASRDSPARDVPSQVHDGVTHSRQVKFKDPVSSSETDGTYVESHHNEREHDPGPSPHSNTFDEPSTSYPAYLQPVAEEPSSSFSEAADDDPLPAIDGLQISGDAFPGRELQACGYSIHGTTSCNFEWVRHLQDGSVNYIDGAKQPTYLVTADDVDTYLAIEVQPLDDRKRKGDLVKVFANEQKKIVCDPAMQSHIEKNLYNGHASYKVSLSTGYLDIWEPATLTIKREGYSIKCSGPSGVAVNEKLTRATTVTLTYGHDTEFSIISSNSVVHLLRADNSISDISSLRDAIVLTLRLFIMKVRSPHGLHKETNLPEPHDSLLSNATFDPRFRVSSPPDFTG